MIYIALQIVALTLCLNLDRSQITAHQETGKSNQMFVIIHLPFYKEYHSNIIDTDFSFMN